MLEHWFILSAKLFSVLLSRTEREAMKLKKLKLTLAALVIGGSSVVMSTQPAQAVYSCSSGYSSTGAYSKCGLPANNWYHTNILCQNVFTLASYIKKGNWVNTNSKDPSTVQGCGLAERYYGDPWASTT